MKKCISCGTKLDVYGLVDGYQIYKCNKCGLGETESKTLPDYQSYHRDATYFKETEQFENIFLKRLHIIQKFISSGRILEAGSSVGTLLSLFKDDGWEVLGVEPSKFAAEQAVKRGIPTKKNTFEEIVLKENSFNVVIFNHVLEHVKDPRGVLNKTCEVLKKDGLVLVDVPNFGSLSSRMWGTKWGYLYPHEHKWHFTKDSLSRLMSQSGFDIAYSETRSGIWDCGDPKSEIWQSLTNFKRRFFKNLLFSIPDYIVSALGQGSGLTVVGRKK
ncbi:MAG: methylase/methyltransferase [Microgenomates group bacterium Gr01-1014_5]|nr:MAG: methylase/methyltransferase [Microgenomates group bacterium Gr01-1014_5]